MEHPDLGLLAELSVKTVEHSDGKMKQMQSIIDSGAARSVCPPSHGPEFGVTPTKSSLRGDGFMTATGKRVANRGGRKVRGTTAEGEGIEMHYAVADGITHALDSVSQICDAGATVTFHRDGGWIEGPSGKKTAFERNGDTYTRTVWVPEVDEKVFTGQRVRSS